MAGVAGPALGQELVRIGYSWVEMHSTNPNSVIDPGEDARISLSLQALINGSDAIGQTTSYSPPPPPGIGTVRGIGTIEFNLRGDGPGAAGSWGTRTVSPIFSWDSSNGTPSNDGSAVTGIRGSQFFVSGSTANGANPIANGFQGIWQPTSYTPRTVNFRVDTAGLGSNAGVSLAVQYGTALLNPKDPTSSYALYTLKNVAIDPGSGINIPIVPAPATGWATAFALAIAGRRRRR
jgi:hypothetical protein